jgi:hypothetical protein
MKDDQEILEHYLEMLEGDLEMMEIDLKWWNLNKS